MRVILRIKKHKANTLGVRGKLYGQFDIKILFVSAVLIFEVGSAISGAALTLNTLIVGRAICGVGAPGLYIGAINLLGAVGETANAEDISSL